MMIKKHTTIIPHMFTHTAFLHYGIKFSFTNKETSDGHKIVRRTNTTPYISINKDGQNIKGKFYNQKFKLPKNFLGDKIIVKNIEEIKLTTIPEGNPAELSDDDVVKYLCKPRSHDVYKRINRIDTTMDLSSYCNELAVYDINKQDDTKLKNETKITIFNLSIVNPKCIVNHKSKEYDGNPMDCVIITRGYHSSQSNYKVYMSDDDILKYLKTAYNAYKIYISFKGCNMDRAFNSIRTFILNNIKHGNINAYSSKFDLSLSSLMKNINFVPDNIVMVDAREKKNSFKFIPLNKCPESILQSFYSGFERNCHYALDCIIKGFANDNKDCLKSMIFKDGLEASMFNNIDPNTTKSCVTNSEGHLKDLTCPSTRVFFISGVNKLQESYTKMCEMIEEEK